MKLVYTDAIQKLVFGFHYPYCSFVSRVLPNITLDGKKLRVFPGVYKPLGSEHKIADLIDSNKDVLDVGCGSGVASIFAASKSRHVTAVDISPQAIANTRLNCEALGIENITVKLSDMYANVEGSFDYILSLPPFFQVSFASPDRQWCTSPTFVDRLFEGAAEHLNPDGRLVVQLPAKFRVAPDEFGARYGLALETFVPPFVRTLSTKIHALAYLHIDMKNPIFIFRIS